MLRVAAVLVSLLVLGTGCSLVQPGSPLACAGTTSQCALVDAVVIAKNADAQFIQTGALMDSLLTSGRINYPQYRPWATFAERYKVVSAGINRAANQPNADGVALLTSAKNLAAELATYFAFAQGAPK